MSDLLGSYARVLRWMVLRLFVPFMAIALPLLVIYGFASPAASDIAAIRHQTGGVPVLVVIADGVSNCRNEAACSGTPPHRSYIVVPAVFRDAAITVVLRYEDAPVVETMNGYAVLIVGLWTLCVALTWRQIGGKRRVSA